MKVLGLNGRTYTVKIPRYRINWNRAREVSGLQATVKRFLKPYWESCVCTEETPIRGCGGSRPMRIDLMNWTRRIVVEVSPTSSHSFNRFFHKDRSGFIAAMKRDLSKEAWARHNGFTYCELDQDDIGMLSPQWWEKTFGIPL